MSAGGILWGLMALLLPLAVVGGIAWLYLRWLARSEEPSPVMGAPPVPPEWRGTAVTGSDASRPRPEAFAAIVEGLGPQDANSRSLHDDVDINLSEAASRLRSLSLKLVDLRGPWANELVRTAGDLSPLEREAGRLKAANSTLELEPHNRRRMADLLTDLNWAALSKDESECDRFVRDLRKHVNRWRTLTKEWLRLRDIAARGIMPAASLPPQDADDHIGTNRFTPAGRSEEFVWCPPRELLSSNQLRSLASWLAVEVTDLTRDDSSNISAVCTASPTGVPLATALSIELAEAGEPRGYLSFNPGSRTFPLGKPSKTDNLVLVDSDVRTGEHLDQATGAIQSYEARVACAVVICENDFPMQEEKRPVLATLIERRQLIRLFLMTDLYRVWTDSRLPATE